MSSALEQTESNLLIYSHVQPLAVCLFNFLITKCVTDFYNRSQNVYSIVQVIRLHDWTVWVALQNEITSNIMWIEISVINGMPNVYTNKEKN